MANARVRVEADLEMYLRSQSQRVIGVAQSDLSAADLSTIANRIIYEHKVAQGVMSQEFIPRLLGWLKGIMSGAGSTPVPLPEQKAVALPGASEDLDFAADFAAQFEE